MRGGTSTAPPEVPIAIVKRWRAERRAFIGALLVFLVLGATGRLGVRTAFVTASGGGYELTVMYAAVTRPGLATPWGLEIRRPGGFDGPVFVATTASYFDLFDENGLDPDPASATADEQNVIWEFEPPLGEVLSVSFDARLEPAVQSGAQGRTQVLEDDLPVVEATYRTVVMP